MNDTSKILSGDFANALGILDGLKRKTADDVMFELSASLHYLRTRELLQQLDAYLPTFEAEVQALRAEADAWEAEKARRAQRQRDAASRMVRLPPEKRGNMQDKTRAKIQDAITQANREFEAYAGDMPRRKANDAALRLDRVRKMRDYLADMEPPETLCLDLLARWLAGERGA